MKNETSTRLGLLQRILFGLLLGFLTWSAQAGDMIGVKIKTLGINKADFPGLIFIAADTDKALPPACQTNLGWAFVLRIASDEDKRMFAMLTSAKLIDAPVRLVGKGLCDSFPSIETLTSVYLQ